MHENVLQIVTVIAASYKGGDIASNYICFLMSQQHGGDYSYIQKTARHDGSHAANVTGSAYEAHIITSLSSR